MCSFWFTGQVLVVLWHCVSCECINLTFHSFIHSFNRITGWFYVRQRYIHIAPYAAARADSIIKAYHLLPDDAQRDHTIIAKINIRGLQRWQYCTPMADPVKVQPISVYIWCRQASQQTLTRTATDRSQPRAAAGFKEQYRPRSVSWPDVVKGCTVTWATSQPGDNVGRVLQDACRQKCP